MKKLICLAVAVIAATACVVYMGIDKPRELAAARVRVTDIYTSVVADGAVTAHKNHEPAISVVVPVAETDIYKISEGNDAEIRCSALPDRTYRGVVTKISEHARTAIQEKSSAVVVDVEISPVGDVSGIKPGYTAEVKIMGDTITDAVTVPYDAVTTYDDGDYVWTLSGEKPVACAVELGCENGDDTQVVSGLCGDETVILNPPWDTPSTDAVINEVTE